MPQVVDRENAERYVWGDGCDGWHLLRQADLGVIEELTPVGTHEQRHRHHHARQCCHVLTGMMVIECEGLIHTLHPGQGLHVALGSDHQGRNGSQHLLRLLAISWPHCHGDREPTAWQQARP